MHALIFRDGVFQSMVSWRRQMKGFNTDRAGVPLHREFEAVLVAAFR
jgi:hypothetical protein